MESTTDVPTTPEPGRPRRGAVDINGLLDLLAEAVAARVARHLAKHPDQLEQSQGREPDFVTEQEIEQRFSIPRKTLQGWRSRGCGPRFVKVGRKVLYPLAELKGFLQARG